MIYCQIAQMVTMPNMTYTIATVCLFGKKSKKSKREIFGKWQKIVRYLGKMAVSVEICQRSKVKIKRHFL
jgi:hypothetical protein